MDRQTSEVGGHRAIGTSTPRGLTRRGRTTSTPTSLMLLCKRQNQLTPSWRVAKAMNCCGVDIIIDRMISSGQAGGRSGGRGQGEEVLKSYSFEGQKVGKMNRIWSKTCPTHSITWIKFHYPECKPGLLLVRPHWYMSQDMRLARIAKAAWLAWHETSSNFQLIFWYNDRM